MLLFDLLSKYNPYIDMLPQFANRQGVGALLYEEVVRTGENPFGTMGLMRLSQYSQKQAKRRLVWKKDYRQIAEILRYLVLRC